MTESIADWLSYRPGDFLMFAPRTYWRLFELHNEAWWPLQLPALLGAAAAAAWLWRGRPAAAALRGGLAALALAGAFVAWAFVWQRYAAINWAAQGQAVALGLGALALAVLAAAPAGPAAATSGVRRGASALLLAAAVLWPAWNLLAGRSWRSVEVVGLAPDPTAVATLAWLLVVRPHAASRKWRCGAWWAAWTASLAGAAFSAAMLAVMGSPQWLPLLAAAACAGGIERRARRAHIPE